MKRSSYDIKKRILMVVKEKEATYAKLEREVNTGFRTIKANCEELEAFGHVMIDKITHPANGRKAHMVSITRQGFGFLEKAK